MLSGYAVFGCVYIVALLIFVPVYLRFLYVILSKKQYRRLQCFQIILQIGFAQILTVPGWVANCLTQIFNEDIFFASLLNKSALVAVQTVGILGFALAVNRLDIICKLPLPSALHYILIGFAWTFYVFDYCIYLTPWAGYGVRPGNMLLAMDKTKPYSLLVSEIVGIVYQLSLVATFFIYVVVVLYMISMQAKIGKERSILFYAGIRFLIDMTMSIVFHYGHLPPTMETEIIIVGIYLIDGLFMPPLLYICINRTMRNEFFNISSKVTFQTTPSTVVVPRSG